eukprot:TRINITY_DN1273_c0_g1_i3.p1 TRINITY_DN1273_c0_g1~~TRINITY_DN1273_c0_g1_i3.p1  ORF type:complete len:535 (+),score=235.83 TRINITY_DN1273_c0_g1_i3:57-1607(+)
MKDAPRLRNRKDTSLTVDIAGTVAAAAQLGMFSPAAISIASPACTLPTPSNYMLSPEDSLRVEASTTRHEATVRLPFPAHASESSSHHSSPDMVQLLNMPQCAHAQTPPAGFIQGQQLRQRQQRESLLMRQQLEMQQELLALQQQQQEQRQIQQMQQQVYTRGLQLAQVADQVKMQQQANAQAQLLEKASPIEPDERRLLAALESRLMDPDYNKYEGSLSMVKLQGYLKSEYEGPNREVVEKKYKGSFHKFIKAHERKFTYFYYTSAEIEEHALTHCDEHEGRLRFEDIPHNVCLQRDMQTAKWRQELVEGAIAEAEQIVREEQLQVRGLMNAFRERTGRRYLAVADSNHALRNLVKGCERFMLTQENTVKLRSEASEEEVAVWLKRLESEKTEKAKVPGKGKGKKRRGAQSSAGSPSKSPLTTSIGSASASPQMNVQLSSPYPYNLLCEASSSSATSTPASVPSAFQVYHPQGQFLGSPPSMQLQQPVFDGFRPHDFNLHNMSFQQYHAEQFAQA